MRMPAPDAATIARKGEIVRALKRLVAAEGVIGDPAGLVPFQSDGLGSSRVSGAASGSAAGPSSSAPRSSSGLRSSSPSTYCARSRLESCSSLMACISCGVITSAWL